MGRSVSNIGIQNTYILVISSTQALEVNEYIVLVRVLERPTDMVRGGVFDGSYAFLRPNPAPAGPSRYVTDNSLMRAWGV